MPFKSPYATNSEDWSPGAEIGYAEPGPENVFLYVLKVRTANVYKIGISNDLGRRLMTLERETGYSLERIGTSRPLHRFQARALEAALHSIFLERCIHGEFFELTPKEFLYGLIKLGDFGFGPAEGYLDDLLPRNAGVGDNGSRMKIGYARLASLAAFPAFQEKAECLELQRCYVDYQGHREKWRTTRMDLRDGDVFHLFRSDRVLRFLVDESGDRTRLRPVRENMIFL